MKRIDDLLAGCAFGLSTIIAATLFASFAAWTYDALGASERELIARAVLPAWKLGGAAGAKRNASAETREPAVQHREPTKETHHANS